MGLCTCYYLLKQDTNDGIRSVTLIENSHSKTLANGSSSKAGGFISRDWHKQPSLSLGFLSWQCHSDMSFELNGKEKYGWQFVEALGLRVGTKGKEKERSKYRDLPTEGKKEEGHGWLREGEKEDLSNGKGGEQAGTGQIDPALFCQTVHEHLSKNSKFTLIFGSPESYDRSKLSITLTPPTGDKLQILPVSKLIVTAGPWSSLVCSKLNLSPINLTNLPGHSLIIKPSPSTSTSIKPVTIFAGIGENSVLGVEHATGGTGRFLTPKELEMGFTEAPELFVRSNGVVYIAGENTVPNSKGGDEKEKEGEVKIVGLNKLPENVDDVPKLMDRNLISRLVVSAEAVSDALSEKNEAVIQAKQLCYRPKTFDGECMIGELQENVFIATGHGPWGITLAPGTGKVLSEMILGLPLSADVSLLGVDRCRAEEGRKGSKSGTTYLARL